MIRIGIAGYGKIGKIRHKFINQFPDTEVSCIYDVKAPEDIDPGIVYFDSFESLIKQNIDAIFICAYNKFLANYTRAALEKGIHVFCEKPPAMHISEMEQVMETYEASGKLLKYGFNHRYHYSIIEAKKVIDSGTLGKPLWMRGVYGKAGSIDYDKEWRNYKKISGGGILIDQGIHMVDLIRYFSGMKFEHIDSHVATCFWDIDVEDNAFALMKSESNFVATLHSSANQWRHKFLLEMCFEEGYINLDGILSETKSYAPEKLIVGKRSHENIDHAMGKPNETISYFDNDDSWKLEINEFLSAIIKGNKILQGTPDDAYETLSLVTRIYENSK